MEEDHGDVNDIVAQDLDDVDGIIFQVFVDRAAEETSTLADVQDDVDNAAEGGGARVLGSTREMVVNHGEANNNMAEVVVTKAVKIHWYAYNMGENTTSRLGNAGRWGRTMAILMTYGRGRGDPSYVGVMNNGRVQWRCQRHN